MWLTIAQYNPLDTGSSNLTPKTQFLILPALTAFPRSKTRLVPKQWPYLSKWQIHPYSQKQDFFPSLWPPRKAKPSSVPRPTWQVVSAHNPLAFAKSSPGALSVLLCLLPHLPSWLFLGSSQLVPYSIRRNLIKCSVSASFSHGFPCCTTKTQGSQHSYL